MCLNSDWKVAGVWLNGPVSKAVSQKCHEGSNPSSSAIMNTRINPDSGIAEIQVDDDMWRSVEDVVIEAGRKDQSLRTYLQEEYGRIIESSPS